MRDFAILEEATNRGWTKTTRSALRQVVGGLEREERANDSPTVVEIQPERQKVRQEMSQFASRGIQLQFRGCKM